MQSPITNHQTPNNIQSPNSKFGYWLLVIGYYLIIGIWLLVIPANTLQTSSNITVTVFVQGAFSLTVNTDSFDFARLMPGQIGEMTRTEGITVAGSSTGGNPWCLKVSATNPLSSGSDIIPNENFTWYGTSEGMGEWSGSAEKSLADPYNSAYISTIDESESAARVANRFKFKLFVPEDTKPGSYTTTVMFTMTE